MKYFTLIMISVTALPACMEAIHGIYPFGQPELFHKKSNCKPIPVNLQLCHDIEYTDMRLPNLLGHETMNEVLQQASSWIPLVQKQCHPDTRKFLCSLFSPVCLDDVDEPIQPCRSLCERVRDGCAPVMSAFGFPWPDMLDCDRFPADNDLCIPPANFDSFEPVTQEGKTALKHNTRLEPLHICKLTFPLTKKNDEFITYMSRRRYYMMTTNSLLLDL